MRKKIAGPIKTRVGQSTRFTCSLQAGERAAFIQLYSYTRGYEPSPHVPEYKLMTPKGGKPTMVNPVTLRLSEAKPSGTIEISADEPCWFVLMQEIDVAGDRTVKVRTNRYVQERIGSALSALGRLLGRRRW